MLKLQFRDRRREAVWLVDQSFTIGSNARNSLMINDSGILDVHAEIINQNNQLVLVDKSAGKGCWVNGKPVTSHANLKKNDVIKLGDIELVLVDPKSTVGSTPKQTQSRPAESTWSIYSKASWLDQSRFNISSRVIIGRDPSCDITLPLDHLSRQHVALEIKNGQLHVNDLDSSNGTFVNGERVSSTVVKPGDKIKLDVVTFEVIGPTHDPNKTIIRSAPASKPKAASTNTAKSSAAAKPKAKPAAQTTKPPQSKKLAAQGKQNWIEGTEKYETKSELNLGPIIGIAIVLVAAGAAAYFLL